MLLANVFHPAISIYLSGVYDYELHFWDEYDYAIPTLCNDKIAFYVDIIVNTVTDALKNSTLSPLLFLFPLRIAGARADHRAHTRLISEALQLISTRFVVALSISSDLEEIWAAKKFLA